MPDALFSRRFQTFSDPTPSGDTMPKPVTTTRRMIGLRSILPFQGCLMTAFSPRSSAQGGERRRSRSARLRLDVFDGILDGLNLLGGIVGNFAAELFLERHHELDRIQTVRAQIVDEGSGVRDLGLLDAEVLDH